jgi:large subunit ribosomal protein L18e
MIRKISKTRIEHRLQGKTNTELVRLVIELKKISPEVAKLLAMPRRKRITKNLEEIDKECKDGEKILVPGKVLGSGNLTKKIKIVALSVSKDAEEKIKKAKSEFVSIAEEIKKNQKLNELRILR